MKLRVTPITAVRMNLPADNFYPSEEEISACLVSQADLICYCLAVGNKQKVNESLLLLPLTENSTRPVQFFRVTVFLWNMQLRTIEKT